MKKLWILIATACLAHPAFAAEPAPQNRCSIEKLAGLHSSAEAWEVSIEKEANRKKEGDAFLAIHKPSGRRCEIELPSWGSGLFLARSKATLFIVEQGDTSYTSLSWIDPQQCRILKTLQEFGSVKITGSKVSFSGGKDGPEKVPGKDFKLGTGCLP